MWIVKRQPLSDFGKRWPAAVPPLADWYRKTKAASWRNFVEVKGVFGQTDQVKVASGNTVTVFDIGGNKFRLVASIHYNTGKVFVLRVLTHKEYDADLWKKQL